MKYFICFPPRWVATGFLSCLFLVAEGRADVTFYDGTFKNSDWMEIPYVNGNGGSSSAAQQTNGGNPGSYYEVLTQVNAGPACGAGVYLRNGFTYTPSTQGPIYNLDYSVDLIAVSFIGEAEPVVSQNGKIYFGPEIYVTAGVWQTVTESNLMATNFNQLITNNPDGELGGDATSHPDFSATGAQIAFGFIVPDSTMSTAYTTIGGVDNYLLTVHLEGLLQIGVTNGLATLSWLATTNDYKLESTPALVPAAWAPVTNMPARSGEFYTVTNILTDSTRFFRLHLN